MFHLLGVGVLGTCFGNAILDDTFGVDDTIGIVDGFNCLVGETTTTQTNEVHTGVTDGLLASDDVRRNVLRGT